MMVSERCLLVDNSNTRTKFMLCGGGNQAELQVVPTAEICTDMLRDMLADWCFHRAFLCSVVPWAAEVILSALDGHDVVCLNAENASEVDFSVYPGKATLGADRVANVLAAIKYVPLPLVAVDLGTATTLDVVVPGMERPLFAGGLIAPGFSAVADSLFGRTALLPGVSLDFHGAAIGKNTGEAMSSAVCIGYPGMIDALLEAVEEELGQAVHVVITGGDAERIAPRLKHKCLHIPTLTLEGLAGFGDVRL